MKAMFSEEYYKKYWDRFLERVPGEHYINLENDLDHAMKVYEGIGLEEAHIATIKKIEAAKIADRCTALVKKEMHTVKEIEAGRASLGYTTQIQEIQGRADLRKRFEFNCLQLREFKTKYGIA